MEHPVGTKTNEETGAAQQFVASAAVAPSIDPPLSDTPQKKEHFDDIVLHRSVLNDLPLFLITMIGSGLAIWITFALRETLHSDTGFDPFAALLFVIACAVASSCATIAFRRYNVRYLIASDGIKALRGVLSNHQVDAKLEYYQIRGTEIRRSFFARLIGTGDLVVRGSTGNDTEVAFLGISQPYRAQSFIQARHRLEVQGSKAAWINEEGKPTSVSSSSDTIA